MASNVTHFLFVDVALSVSVSGQMVFQACNHPFVLQMDYAFQTELHAIIVLNLITTGNLQVPCASNATASSTHPLFFSESIDYLIP